MDFLSFLGEIGLGSRLKRLSEAVMKDIQTIYNEQNIDFDPYLFPAFHSIATKGPITNTALYESLGTSQPAVTQTINKLVKKNLVTTRTDLSDRRKKQIELSADGKSLLLKMRPVWKVMDETVKRFTTSPANTLINHIEILEREIYSGNFLKTMRTKFEQKQQSMAQIIGYSDDLAPYFYDFNIEWLETYFYVEPYDKEVLSNPRKYITDPGGYIFFAKENEDVTGTVALIPCETGVFELTKMAVSPEHRGKKIGQKLMQHCIDFARNNGFKKLILYSNTKLENAIYIYRKYGFREIPIEPDCPYERSNIKMELLLYTN